MSSNQGPDELRLRGQVDRDLAVLIGVPSASIRTGPAWLWEGSLRAPLRASDLPAKLMSKVDARSKAVPDERWPDAPGPRHYRFPAVLAALAARWPWWFAGGAVLTVSTCAMDGTALTPILGSAAAIAILLTLVGMIVLSADVTDPLRLTVRDRELLGAAVDNRTVTWNPLTHSSTVSAGAGYVLYAADLLGQIDAHHVFDDPLFAAALGDTPGLDIGLELFLFARAGERLDRLDWCTSAATAEPWPDQSRASGAFQERSLLDVTLRSRVTALRGYLNELDAAQETVSRQHRMAEQDAITEQSEGFVVVAEAELTAKQLAEATDRVAAAARAIRDVATLG